MKNAHSNSIAILIFLILFSRTFADETKLGDVNEGSQAVPVHVIDMHDATGAKIRPDDHPIMPFSTKQTCIQCHNYDKIRSGWHFNANDPDVDPGRPGEPWILSDQITATQIPMSYRAWPGVYNPKKLGITSWDFVQKFGRQMPGGGVGENGDSDPDSLYLRWMLSGKLEINCLSCHDADAAHDQAEYAAQMPRQNFRWAPAASCAFAEVQGSAKDMPDNYDIYFGGVGDEPRKVPPSVKYKEGTFNSKGKVFFNVVRQVPNERCYYCHSTKYIAGDKTARWQHEQDIHLKSGMMCVDCHRNGLDHQMVRGYEGEAQETGKPSVASLSCKGCHIPDKSNSVPVAGRMGAPVPKHAGIPTIHFEKLSCTACHSGPWPSGQTQDVKTSKAHALGVHGAAVADDAAPRIVGPVFVKGQDGKIAPHELIFPSFWASIEGDSVKPILPDIVRPFVVQVITADTLTDSTNIAKMNAGEWPDFTKSKISQILLKLATKDSTKSYGYINAGKLYHLTADSQLVAENNPAAQPYSWAFAHNVRPASQALGARGCQDCHSLKAPFQFANVVVHSPIVDDVPAAQSMLSFEKVGVIYPRLFALSFLFRPWLKIFLIFCVVVLVAVLGFFAFKGFDKTLKSISKKQW